MNGAVHLCFTTAGLDELTRREQRSAAKVLQTLKRLGRFSVFEATANETIAGMMDFLRREKLIEIEPKGFPWSDVRVTEAGEQRIKEDLL